MSKRDYYSILGVSPDSPAPEIRKAYVRISRVIHPDRFDSAAQPEDWEQANRMLSEINEAWQTLKDPERRRQYDHRAGFSRVTYKSESRKEYTKRPAKPERDAGPEAASAPDFSTIPVEITKGESPLDKLPQHLQDIILQREKGGTADHYAVDTDRPLNHYLKAGLLPIWALVLWFSSLGSEWGTVASVMMFAITVMVAFYFAGHLYWLIRWYTSPLSCRVYITPLYVIETSNERVSWWPVTGIRETRITNENPRYATSKTMLSLVYPDRIARFPVAPVRLARNCVHMLSKHKAKAAKALRAGDYEYFRRRNDFDGAESAPVMVPKATGVAAYTLPVIIGVMLFASAYQSNLGNEAQIGSRLISQMLPLHGSNITYFNRDAAVAPLELEATGFRHYIVKINHYETGSPVMTLFVRSNRKKHVRLPDGIYQIKYAGGYNWYGPDDLFGPDGRYYIETEPFEFSSTGNRLSGHLIRLGDESRLESGEVMLTVPEAF